MGLKSFLSNIFTVKAEKKETESVNDSFLNPSNKITITNAQKIAVVYSCVRIKMNALSVIPLKLYKNNGVDKSEFVDNLLYNILRYEPNKDLTSSTYKKIISQDLDLRGNHYSQIVRNGLGQIVALYPLRADNMTVMWDIQSPNKKVYTYNGVRIREDRILHVYDIPDKENLMGLSPIEYAKNSLEFANNTAQHGNMLFKNGAMPTGIFKNEKALTTESHARLKEQLGKNYTGLRNVGKPMLLDDGLDFKELSIKNSDAEWLASRKFNREEIASIFGVPVAMLNDSENTSYGNLEQKYLEFKDNTIFPLTTNIEERFRQKLLTYEEKRTLSIKFEYNNLMRVDAKTRMEYFKGRFETASISPNEIRRFENENGFDGGDEYYYQSNNLTPVGQVPDNKGII